MHVTKSCFILNLFLVQLITWLQTAILRRSLLLQITSIKLFDFALDVLDAVSLKQRKIQRFVQPVMEYLAGMIYKKNHPVRWG